MKTLLSLGLLAFVLNANAICTADFYLCSFIGIDYSAVNKDTNDLLAKIHKSGDIEHNWILVVEEPTKVTVTNKHGDDFDLNK